MTHFCPSSLCPHLCGTVHLWRPHLLEKPWLLEQLARAAVSSGHQGAAWPEWRSCHKHDGRLKTSADSCALPFTCRLFVGCFSCLVSCFVHLPYLWVWTYKRYFGTKSLTPFDCSKYWTTSGGEVSEIKKMEYKRELASCEVVVMQLWCRDSIVIICTVFTTAYI